MCADTRATASTVAYALPTGTGSSTLRGFAVEGWWIPDFASLVRRIPAMLIIEAVEDSELPQLERSAQAALCDRVPKCSRFFRLLLENAFIAHE